FSCAGSNRPWATGTAPITSSSCAALPPIVVARSSAALIFASFPTQAPTKPHLWVAHSFGARSAYLAGRGRHPQPRYAIALWRPSRPRLLKRVAARVRDRRCLRPCPLPGIGSAGIPADRNWDSNTVLVYLAKFYPGIQAFAYWEMHFSIPSFPFCENYATVPRR